MGFAKSPEIVCCSLTVARAVSRSIQIAACAFVCETTRNRGLHGAPSAFVKMDWWVRPRVVHLIQSWHTPCTHTHSPCACLPPLSSEIKKNLSRTALAHMYREGAAGARRPNCEMRPAAFSSPSICSDASERARLSRRGPSCPRAPCTPPCALRPRPQLERPPQQEPPPPEPTPPEPTHRPPQPPPPPVWPQPWPWRLLTSSGPAAWSRRHPAPE